MDSFVKTSRGVQFFLLLGVDCLLLDVLTTAEGSTVHFAIIPVVQRLAVAFPAALTSVLLLLCGVGRDGSLVDDLHAGAPVFSGPLPTAGETGSDGLG